MHELLAILVACTLFTGVILCLVFAERWWRRRAGWARLHNYSRSGLVAWQLWRRRSRTLRLTDRSEEAISDGLGTSPASGPNGP